MKTSQLDPVIGGKLRAFGRRRRRLIVLRGACAAIVSLLGSMTLVAIPDYLMVLPEGTRMALSAAAYLVAVVAVWVTCLRTLAHIPNQRRLALLMESTEPSLREDVIAAVELAANEDVRFDSPVFRNLVQERVAHRMADVDVRSLLPGRLVGAWVMACAVVLAACGGLMLVPGLSYGSMLARAMAPGADIERRSSVKIAIVEPLTPAAVAPEGDAVRIVAEVAGDAVGDATLELLDAGGRRQRMPMTPQDQQRFIATFVLGKEPVAYRVLAGDGATRRYTIASRPRPYVAAFEKTFRYPAYTGLPSQVRTEPHGDVAALEGAQVDLVLEADQPIASGELRLDTGSAPSTIPLKPEGRRLTVTLPVAASGTYRVHLVAEGTRFENKFSPRYEINAQPDMPPRVEMAQPASNLLLPPDEIVAVRGSAEDDLPLVSVQQMIRVNDGAWSSVPVSEQQATRVTVSRAWDLFGLRLRVGDKLTTKLVATDRKGSRGESNPIVVTIASEEFDLKRLTVLEGKSQADGAIKRLLDAWEAQRRVVEESINKLLALPADSEQARSYQAVAAKAIEDARAASQAAVLDLIPVIGQMRPGADAHDMAAVAQVVARIEHDHARTAARQLVTSTTALGGDREKRLRSVLGEMREGQSEAAQLYRRSGEMVSAELLGVMTADLRVLAEDQARVAAELRQPVDPASTWRRVARRLSVAVNQTRFIEELLQRHGDRVDRGRWRAFSDPQRRVAEARDFAQKLLDAPEPDMRLADASRTMKEAVDRLHQQVRAAEAESARQFGRSRRSMEERADTGFKSVERLKREIQESAKLFGRLEDPKKRPRSVTQLEAERAKLAAINRDVAELYWPMAIAIVRSMAIATEARPDSDARFAADVGLAARALEQLQARYRADQEVDPEGLRRVAELVGQVVDALRTLKGVHDVKEIGAGVAGLADAEQWKLTTAAAHTLHPWQWDYVDPQMDYVARSLRWNKAWHEAAQVLSQIAHRAPTQQTRHEMEGRRTAVRAAQSMRQPLETIGQELDRVLAMMQARAAEARAALQDVSPKLARLLREMAAATRHTAETIRAAAQQARDDNAQRRAEQVREAAQQQEQLRRQLTDVTDALRQHANVQDIMTPQGRQEARDADAAGALVRDTSRRVSEAMNKAQAAAQAPDQARAMEQAAAQQDKLTADLQQLAEHYENTAAGRDAAETRQQLRRAEREMALARPLDEQYRQLERLSDLANMKPSELMKELERELAQNRAMQGELDAITRAALETARADLGRAAEMEKQQADQVAKAAASQAQSQHSLAEQLKQVKHEAGELAQRQAPEAVRAAEAASMQEPARSAQEGAQQAMRAAEKLPTDAVGPPERLAQELSEQGKPLEAAAEKLQQAATEARSGSEQAREQARQAQQIADAAANEAKAAAQQQPDSAAAKDAARRAEQAAATARSMNGKAEQAIAAEQKTTQAAEKSQQLAQKARELAQTMKKQAAAARQQMVQAAGRQQPIAQAAEQASKDVARAGRHEMRLGHEEAGARLQQQAAKTAQTAQREVPEAQRRLMQADKAADAQPAVQKAADALAQQSQDLSGMSEPGRGEGEAAGAMGPAPQPENSANAPPAAAMTQPAAQEARPGAPASAQSNQPSGDPQATASRLGGASAEYLARALDQLDRSMHEAGEPGGAPGEQMARAADAAQQAARSTGQGEAQQASGAAEAMKQALRAAAAAQAKNMQASRAKGVAPGETPLSPTPAAESTQGAKVEAGEMAYQELPGAQRVAGEWGKLPPQLARDLMEGRRENISPEYRAMVEAYFNALARRSRGDTR